MREEFKNILGATLIFDDEGITYHRGGEAQLMSENILDNCFCPYGSIIKIGTFLCVNIVFAIKGERKQVSFLYEKEDKKRIKSMIEFTKNAMKNAVPADGVNLDSIKEHRLYCNVCKNIFCYTDEDLRKNKINNSLANNANNRAIAEGLGGSRLMANYKEQESEMYKSKIIDYSKCPHCGSIDIREMNENE